MASIRRRDFIAAAGSTAVVWPLVARAQRIERMRRIGVLTLLSSQDEGGRVADFVAGLRGLGYNEGHDLDIDYRYADGDTERLDLLARELVALKPDLIYAGEPTAARAVKRVAPTLPIVCASLGDHLSDLFASYAKPGGSVTGLAMIVEGLNAKQVEIALELVPGAMRIGLLVNPHGANRDFIIRQVEAATRTRGLTAFIEEAPAPEKLADTFEQFSRAQAVIIAPNGMFINQRRSIVELALRAGLPTIYQDRADVDAGGLASYGLDYSESYRRAAMFVDKILKGAKPGDLPIEFPTKLVLVINLKTAKAIGLEMPPSLLARADEVIE
jgi:putative ABC transport system substrate-binding protein